VNHKLLSYILVALQISAVILCCFPFGKTDKGFMWGLLLFAIGSVSGAITIYFNKLGNFSIYPEIKHNASLITNGPYKYIRHPMYTSLFIMMLGITIYNFHYLNFIGLALLTPVLIAKAHIEESLLNNQFSTYASYKAKTKKFIPFIF
jgi:protein-S-isoprenylcysteine O-methyltransferase Ste14